MSIMTVKGPISAEDAGLISPHEHIFIDITNEFIQYDPISKRKLSREKVSISNLDVLSRNPFVVLDNLLLDEEEVAIDEVMRFRDAGGQTIVDVTNIGIGRDPEALRRISIRTGVNLVAGCGYYTQDTHPSDMELKTMDDIAEEMFCDIKDGINGTAIKAGIIGEIGTGKIIHENEKKVLTACGKIQKETGMGIHIHTYPWGDKGLEALDILKKNGAEVSKIAIDHIDVQFNMDYCREIMSKGAFIEFDNFGKEFYIDSRERKDYAGGIFVTDLERVNALKEFIEGGFTDHILLTCDVCLKTLIHRYGGWGYDHILTNIVPMMREIGIDENAIETILYKNPLRLLDT